MFPIDPALSDNLTELKEICREIGAIEMLTVRAAGDIWLCYENPNDPCLQIHHLKNAGLTFVARFTNTDGGPAGMDNGASTATRELILFAEGARRLVEAGQWPGLSPDPSDEEIARLQEMIQPFIPVGPDADQVIWTYLTDQGTIEVPIVGELTSDTRPADFTRMAQRARR